MSYDLPEPISVVRWMKYCDWSLNPIASAMIGSPKRITWSEEQVIPKEGESLLPKEKVKRGKTCATYTITTSIINNNQYLLHCVWISVNGDVDNMVGRKWNISISYL